MQYYPICLDIRGRKCLVVGGGGVGTRKVKTLLECGARVTVVSPEGSGELSRLAEEGRVVWEKRAYLSDDIRGVFLVIGATSDMALNESISRDADRANILCNIADVPRACNFILPAVVRRGDLQLAVSTGGKSPAFARYLRQTLEKQFGQEYAVLLDLMGRIREKLLAEAHQPEAHKPLFEALIAGGLLEMIRDNDNQAIDRLLSATLGEAYMLDRLGNEMPVVNDEQGEKE